MSEDDEDETRRVVLEAVIFKIFGRLVFWKKPKVYETIGPYIPDAFDDFEKKLRTAIAAETKMLVGQTESQLRAILAASASGTRDKFAITERNEIGNFRELIDEMPPWFLGGFGNQQKTADFSYWAGMPKVTVLEAACLTIGFEPDDYELKLFNSFSWTEPCRFFQRRLDQFERKFGNYESKSLHLSTVDYVDWGLSINMPIHRDLIAAVAGVKTGTPASVDAVVADVKPGSKEMNSLATLILAMAIDHYGFVPSASRSVVPKQIQDMIATLGLDISQDTIRKYLNLGERLLPKDWQPTP